MDILSKKVANSESKTHEADGVALRGEDRGKWGRLCSLVFHPNHVALKGMNEEQVSEIVDKELSKQLWSYCEKIGWWPDINHKTYEINKQTDGTYLLTSYLKRGTKKSILAHENTSGVIGLNND